MKEESPARWAAGAAAPAPAWEDAKICAAHLFAITLWKSSRARGLLILASRANGQGDSCTRY